MRVDMPKRRDLKVPIIRDKYPRNSVSPLHCLTCPIIASNERRDRPINVLTTKLKAKGPRSPEPLFFRRVQIL